MKLLHVVLAASLLAPAAARGEVKTDGSLGPQVTLKGKFDIPSGLGRIVGSNLFHSFSEFNIAPGESATFTNPSQPGHPPVQISNIISRVTGGKGSHIGGAISISNEMSGANLYLVNPSGIMFGAGATVDVSGSFYATTADYLQIGAVQFDARTAALPENFHLATVPPSAFGFLGRNPAPITVTDSNLSAAGSLTFVGGDLIIKREQNSSKFLLFSPDGLNLVSVGSPGEAVVSDAGIATSTFSTLGSVKVSAPADSLVDIKTSRGRIFISAGSFIADGAYIASMESGNRDSGGLTILASDVEVKNGAALQSKSERGKSGDIDITATSSITVSNETSRQSAILSSGIPGTIALEAPKVTLVNSSVVAGGDVGIKSENLELTGLGSGISGIGGSVTVDTGTLTMKGGNISASASGAASESEGNIFISAREKIDLSDKSTIGAMKDGSIDIYSPDAVLALDQSYIYLGNWAGASTPRNRIAAKDITIVNGGRIASYSAGSKAGDIEITASGQVTVSGNGSLIRSNNVGSKEGAGNIRISAATVVVDRGGAIDSWLGDPERGPQPTEGDGGSVEITATESVTVSGRDGEVPSRIDVSTLEEGKGNAGTLTIDTPLLLLAEGGTIRSDSQGVGDAGKINLHIGELLFIDAGSISTKATSADGGDIMIDPPLAYLRNGSISTSVSGGIGDGGNISLQAGSLVLESSSIKADAHGGSGGAVRIVSDVFFADAQSSVTASSELGVPGTVDITAPLVDISGNLVMLPERMLQDDDLTPRTCAATGAASSSFILGTPPLASRPQRNLPAF